MVYRTGRDTPSEWQRSDAVQDRERHSQWMTKIWWCTGQGETLPVNGKDLMLYRTERDTPSEWQRSDGVQDRERLPVNDKDLMLYRTGRDSQWMTKIWWCTGQGERDTPSEWQRSDGVQDRERETLPVNDKDLMVYRTGRERHSQWMTKIWWCYLGLVKKIPKFYPGMLQLQLHQLHHVFLEVRYPPRLELLDLCTPQGKVSSTSPSSSSPSYHHHHNDINNDNERFNSAFSSKKSTHLVKFYFLFLFRSCYYFVLITQATLWRCSNVITL